MHILFMNFDNLSNVTDMIAIKLIFVNLNGM